MNTPRVCLSVAAAVALGVTVLVLPGAGQQFVTKSPTAQDWAAMAKLPDFHGVWERGGGGGRGRGSQTGPSLTAKADALRQAYRAIPREDNETANCLPPGMPGIMNQPYPMEFLVTPGKVTIIIEAYTQVRHIYTDGRPLPEDPNLEFHGNSIGRWGGDTLIVETVGFSPLTSITAGVPFSDRARIVERFQLTAPDTMQIETTITDPVMLREPYTTTSFLQRHRDWTITEYICEENNRNSVDSQGKAGIDISVPTSPR